MTVLPYLYALYSERAFQKGLALPDKDKDSSDQALMALIDEHEPLLRGIIQSDVHNSFDANDVFQETVTAILEHFRAGKPVKHTKAWMVQIAKNRCVDFTSSTATR